MLTTTVQKRLTVFGGNPAFQVERIRTDTCNTYPPMPAGIDHELFVSHHGRLFGLSSSNDFGKRKLASFAQLIALTRVALRRF